MKKHSNCVNCGKFTKPWMNYCNNIQCHIEYGKKCGLMQYTPNNLPITCITGTHLLEVDGSLHKDYKFPVNIISDGNKELAALIYYDKYVALVLFEYCYLLFSLSKGKLIKGLTSYSDDFILDKESIDKIKGLIKE